MTFRKHKSTHLLLQHKALENYKIVPSFYQKYYDKNILHARIEYPTIFISFEVPFIILDHTPTEPISLAYFSPAFFLQLHQAMNITLRTSIISIPAISNHEHEQGHYTSMLLIYYPCCVTITLSARRITPCTGSFLTPLPLRHSGDFVTRICIVPLVFSFTCTTNAIIFSRIWTSVFYFLELSV